MSELNGHEEDRLAEAVECTLAVDFVRCHPRPLGYLDILGELEEIRRATNGAGVWGCAAGRGTVRVGVR